MKPKVVVAETLAEAGLAALAESCRVDLAIGLSRSDLTARLADAAGLVVRSATKVDRELIEAGPGLRVIGRAGIGVDNIDLAAATERGVLVVNAPDANTVSAAEHTMALLLAQARNIPRADATLRSGSWDRSSFQGVELFSKTLGVIGLGRIGTLVAERCRAFGMRVVSYDPFVTEERGRRLGVEMVPLGILFEQANFITIHLPKTKDTEGLLGKDGLARVKRGVRIVNTSRGGIIDETALAEAIRDGRVGGAALDVFSVEPLSESPLFELSEVVVTPHLGASTAEAQDKAGVHVAEAVAAALRGELVLSAVNLDLGREVTDEVRAFLSLAEQLGRALVGLAGGVSGQMTMRAEGRIAGSGLRTLKLAVLKGVMGAVSTEPVSYVNAPRLADQRGIRLDLESSEEAVEYVSKLAVSVTTRNETVSLAGTLGRKGPMLVEILDHEVELPFSPHLLVIRNSDTPGVIGRVGTYLGEMRVNIANMVVGQSPVTGNPALMGLALDQGLSEQQVSGLRMLTGIEDARYLDLS